MPFRQKLEQKQKTVFSQALQQSVRILELPILELQGIVEAEIAENPIVEEFSQPSSLANAKEPAEQRTNASEEYSAQTFDKEFSPKEFDGLEKIIPGQRETLSDFLLKQLRINAAGERQIALGTFIIQRLDENGYLHEDLKNMSEETGATREELLESLKLIQTFEPSGVGARDLKECLVIQLNKNQNANPLAIQIVENYLTELVHLDSAKLCKKLKCENEQLAAAIAKIRALEPKPGRDFSSDEVSYVTPDVTIEEKDGEFTVLIKDDSIPIIRVNPLYKNMLKSKKTSAETKEFIRGRMLRATNLLNAIQTRKNTLTKVVALISNIQREAIINGLDKLNPLSIKEIAERVKLHESTVSRVVTNKYIQTPYGIFPLKELFSSSIKTEDGEDVAIQKIKAKIMELVDNEDKVKPLKDQELAALIHETEKITLARRTVAKYRESLKIPIASQRKIH